MASRFQLFRRFSSDQNGAVAILFGLCLIIVFMFSSLATDSARIYDVTSRVQAALDAAALAGAKSMDIEGASAAQIQQRAKQFFESRVAELRIGKVELTDFIATPDETTSTVTASVNVSMSTMFGSLFKGGAPTAFPRTASATYETIKIELSLVVDITGSMADSGKIDSLKVAAKELVDTLFASNPGPQQIRVALVPYSASVNAGSFHDAVTNGGGGATTWSWSSWGGGWAASGTDTCVVERDGSHAYTDAAPNGAGVYLGTSSTADNSNYSCPEASVTPLADLADATQRNNFKAAIDALTPIGGTAGHLGTAWGWYMLSPDWAYLWPAANRPLVSQPKLIKAVILMTDGDFNTSYKNGSINATDPSSAGSSPYQALQLCQNMKVDGLTIYSVSFMAPAIAEATLRQCSGNENFYDANSSSDLIGAFRDIVERLSKLRVTS